MGASDFLDKVLDSFVCVGDLIASIAYSDEKKILSLQETARVVLGCLRSIDKPPKAMLLDGSGLPTFDPDSRANLILFRIAGSNNFVDVRLGAVDEDLRTENAELLKYGFSREIWEVLRIGGIQTAWRLDARTGKREYTVLSSVWKATPREISVLLERQGYKRPVVVSLIRKGYAIPAITLSGVFNRTGVLELDQEIDVGDVSRWLSKNGIEWPIPAMVEHGASEPLREKGAFFDRDEYRLMAQRLAKLELETADLLQQNTDLHAQLMSVRNGVGKDSNQPGFEFPYATRELDVMRQVALKYWAHYTPEMRQPKQDAVQRELCSLLGLNVPAGKTPPHKAIYLATAIKPDDLPKA